MEDARRDLPAPSCPPVGVTEIDRVLATAAAVAGATGARLHMRSEQTGAACRYTWGEPAPDGDVLAVGSSAGFQLELHCAGVAALPTALKSLLRQLLAGIVAAHAAAHESRLLQRLLDGTADPLLLFDGAGTILHANAAADRLLGRQTEEGLAVRSAEGAQPLLAAICQAVQQAADGSGAHSLDLALDDGRVLTCDLHAVVDRTPTTVAAWLRVAPLSAELAAGRLAASCRLSPREVEVLQQLIEGRTAAEVAGALGISTYTVRDHLKRLYRKTGTGSRNELLALLSRTPSAGGA